MGQGRLCVKKLKIHIFASRHAGHGAPAGGFGYTPAGFGGVRGPRRPRRPRADLGRLSGGLHAVCGRLSVGEHGFNGLTATWICVRHRDTSQRYPREVSGCCYSNTMSAVTLMAIRTSGEAFLTLRSVTAAFASNRRDRDYSVHHSFIAQ